MATLNLGGAVHEIAPFRLRELRLAAPFIDRIAARARGGDISSVAGVVESAADMVGVLAVGIAGADPAVLEADLALSELQAVRAAFEQVMQEAGLTKPGEPRGTGPQAAASAAPSPPSSTG